MLDAQYPTAALNHAMLSALACSLPGMDQRKIHAMGLTADQAHRLGQLTTADMMRLASCGTNCVRFEVDSNALETLFQKIDRESNRNALILDCIRHGASRDMMIDLFGIAPRRFTRLRQQCGLSPNPGRPADCSLEDAERILDAWRARGSKREAETLLSMAIELDLSLRTIWNELDHYIKSHKSAGAAHALLAKTHAA